MGWLWFTVCLVVGAAFGVAVTLVVRRFQVGHPEDDSLAGVKLTGIYTVFAVILGFVVFSSWQFYLDATDSVRQEAAGAAVVSRNAIALPDNLGDPVLVAIQNYLALAVDDEWKALHAGQTSPATREALENVNRAVVQLPVDTSEAVSNTQDEMLYNLGEMETARADRLYFAENADPGFVWALLLIGGIVTVILSATLHFRSKTVHVLMVASLSGIIAISLFSVYALNRPFTGPFSVTPAPLIHVSENLVQD